MNLYKLIFSALFLIITDASISQSDCIDGINVCTDLNFTITPNGIGNNTTEIPVSGSVGNPSYDPFFGTPSPWGGQNTGCLIDGEKNSTWMYINILTAGTLEFTFGGHGAQAGFYDWIMYRANIPCGTTKTTAPIRCNWNAVNYGGTGIGTVPAGGGQGNFEPALTVSVGDVYVLCFSNYSNSQTSVPLQFGGTSFVSCSPLPVELSKFNVSFSNHNNQKLVDINWITQSEKNNDYFIVERSINGIDYKNIGEIKGAGNSSAKLSYNFKDFLAIEGEVNYYRLKQVDFDGKIEYSPVKKVKIDLNSSIIVYPNPSNGNFKVKLKGQHSINKDYNLILYSAFGNTVNVQTTYNQNNIIEFRLNNEIQPGLYYLNVVDTEGLIIFNQSIIIE